MKCVVCGYEGERDAVYCSNCGALLPKEEPPVPPVSDRPNGNETNEPPRQTSKVHSEGPPTDRFGEPLGESPKEPTRRKRSPLTWAILTPICLVLIITGLYQPIRLGYFAGSGGRELDASLVMSFLMPESSQEDFSVPDTSDSEGGSKKFTQELSEELRADLEKMYGIAEDYLAGTLSYEEAKAQITALYETIKDQPLPSGVAGVYYSFFSDVETESGTELLKTSLKLVNYALTGVLPSSD